MRQPPLQASQIGVGRSQHLLARKQQGDVDRHAIEDDLTDRQRYVFVSVTLNDACPGELAAQLGSTRNAIYKVLFDARRNLQASLHAAGYRPAVCVRPSLTAA